MNLKMDCGRSNSAMNVKGFLRYDWGKVRHLTWLTFILVSFLFLDHTTLAEGFPLEEEMSQAARAAAIGMGSGSSGGVGHSHHHDHGGSRSMQMPRVETEDIDATGGRTETYFPRLAAMDLLLHKAAAAAAARTAAEEELEMRREDDIEEEAAAGVGGREEIGTSSNDDNNNGRGRALWMDDDFHKKASQLCRTSATLQCGKRILILAEDEKNLSVHMKCDLRDDFQNCIQKERNKCLQLARSSILPELPPKEVIKLEQSKLWSVLWTAGGCILSN